MTCDSALHSIRLDSKSNRSNGGIGRPLPLRWDLLFVDDIIQMGWSWHYTLFNMYGISVLGRNDGTVEPPHDSLLVMRMRKSQIESLGGRVRRTIEIVGWILDIGYFGLHACRCERVSGLSDRRSGSLTHTLCRSMT